MGVCLIKVCLTFFLNYGLLDNFSDNGLLIGLCDYSLFEDFMHYCILHFFVSLVEMLLVHNGHMLLFDQGSVFLMNDWLMMLMDVFLNDHWLMVLMNNVLVVLMQNVFLVFHDHILVMLMDHVLIDFLDNGSSNVSPHISSKLVFLNGLSFIGLLDECLLLVADDDWLLIDLLHDNFFVLNKSTWGMQVG